MGIRIRTEWLGDVDRSMAPASIIVPTYNGAALLDVCLRSLHEATPAPMPVEVIVADDGSSDATPQVVERWSRHIDHLRLVHTGRNAGFVDACNAGADAAGRNGCIPSRMFGRPREP